MIIEACRLVGDWLNDPTNGINAMLALIPIDAGDTAPAAIAAGAIVDATRDGNAARGRLPAVLPGFAVCPQVIEGLSPHLMIGDAEGDIAIAVRFGMTNPQTAQGFRDTSYYLRAAVRSLRRFNGNSDATVRQRNQIYLESCTEMRAVQLWEAIEDSVVTGAVLAKYHVRDNAAT